MREATVRVVEVLLSVYTIVVLVDSVGIVLVKVRTLLLTKLTLPKSNLLYNVALPVKLIEGFSITPIVLLFIYDIVYTPSADTTSYCCVEDVPLTYIVSPILYVLFQI